MLNQTASGHAIKIIGHRNPDTDSICAAIAYSRLKNRIDPEHAYKPCRAGALNRETDFVLGHFGVPVPELYDDVRPQIRDVDFRRTPGVDGEMSLRRVWMTMRDENIDTLCVVDGDDLQGMITVKDIATANLNSLDTHILADAKTSYGNIVDTLNAEVLFGDIANKTVKGNIVVAAGSPEQIEQAVSKGDIVILTNRAEGQLTAIEMDAGCIVVCSGSQVSRAILMLAEEKDCVVLRTDCSPYVAGQLLPQAVPIRHYMVESQDLLTFTLNSLVEDATKVMATVRHHYFPVVDGDDRYLGMLSRRNVMNLHKKQLILVDHNEKSQAAEGLADAEVLEIIDHHRISALETDGPVYFRNVPVGCTCTIIYQMYLENGVEIDPSTAGLMLSAILSDTLMFRSPTCTAADQQAAKALAAIAGVDMEQYADAMFEAGGDVSGKTAEEVFNGDYKVFTCGNLRFGVGQSSYLSEKNRKASQRLVGSYLETALNKQRLDYIFYMFTDVRTSTTSLLMAGPGSEEVVTKAFGTEVRDGMVLLPGVVSRKQQVIPALMGALKQLSD